MPNPLIGSARLNTGKRADDRPHATPPVLEAYEGDNNAYRGTQDHGVPSKSLAIAIDDDEWEDTVSGEMEIEKEPVAPVPVRIVSEYTREFRKFQTGRGTVGTTGTRIVGRRNGRTACLIVNNGANTIYIGDTESVQPSTGFPIGAGGSITVNAEAAVYAIAETDANAIAIWDEFSVKE